MSLAQGQHGRPLRRVRHEARDALAVVVFSAAASVLLAVTLTLVLALAG
jgi:ABC-type microcin C transport system permease subunit YejE